MNTFIPPQATKQFSAQNRSDIFGNLSETRGMDFNKRGYLSLAAKPYALLTETVEANFETPLAILMDDRDVYVITTESMYTIDPAAADMSYSERIAGTAPTLGFQSDGVFFNGTLHASSTSGVSDWSGSTWTSRITGLPTSYPHPVCVSEHQQYLAVANGNTVRVYNSSYVLQATMTIPSDHVVTWIRWRANFLWCGTRNIQGGDARVYVWNGSGTAAQAAYPIPGEWAFSGCVYPGTIVVVSSTGQLLRFAGDDFVPLRDDAGNEMAFPCYWANKPWGSSAATSNLRGKVTSRGMEAKGRLIYMMVDSNIATTNGGTPDYLHNFPSGLWVFDPSIGLYHKSGVDHLQRQKVALSSINSNLITIASAADFETGDPVHLVNNITMTGVDNLIYYAIKVTSTTLYLARTPKEAFDDNRVTIAGTVDGELLFNVYESTGSVKLGGAGGLAVIKSLTFDQFHGKEVIFAADAVTPTGTTIGSVMSLGMGRNEGFFVSPKIQASSFTDKFKKLMAKYPPLNLASHEIIIKYRIETRWGLPGRLDFDSGSLIWVDSTSFTVNPTTFDFYAVQEGDEIQFLYKGAGGFTRHITDITVDSTTQWTITIDEAVPDVTAADTTRAVINNWTKYKTISTAADAQAAATGLKKMLLAKDAKWCQVKILMRGYQDIEDTLDVEELMLLTGADQKYA